MSPETIDTLHLKIPLGQVTLEGDLNIPGTSGRLVIFSHGSGSGRFSSRNRFVSNYLNNHHIATFLFDLLTEEESEIIENRFDIALLSGRLAGVFEFLTRHPQTASMKCGVFGASTGAASAMNLAVKYPELVKSVVSRGGRVDLCLHPDEIKAPTLLIVGGLDTELIKWNKTVYDLLTCKKSMQVVEGAGHLFEEEGKLKEVARLAADWFEITL